MLPRLRLRKISRRLISNRKGFSSIVGAVFAVLVMFTLISTVFVWSLSQNTLYNGSVRQSNLEDLDRSNERIVTNVTCNRINNSTVSVNGTLENNGPLSVQIVTLWVVNANNTNYAYKTPLNITLPPGNVTTLSGSTVINVTLPNSDGDNLSCWFISARGNTISKYGVSGGTTTIVNGTTTIYYNSTITNSTITNSTIITNSTGSNTRYANVSQGIGAVCMDFSDFRYFHVSGSGQNTKIVPAELPNGSSGYYITSSGNGLIFRLNLTNYDEKQRNITLTSHSAFWMLSPTSNPQQPRSDWWYIVNVNTTGNIVSTSASTYSNITLPFGIPISVYFSSSVDVASISQPSKFAANAPVVGNAGAVNLMLFGSIGTDYFGQNLPFVSIYIFS